MIKKILLSAAALVTLAGPTWAADFTLVGEDDWFPYAAKAEGKPGYTGFAYDVITAAMQAAGKSVEFKTMPYARCMEVVKSAEELGCFNTNFSEDYAADYVFHKTPIFTTRVAILAHAGSAESGLTGASLANKTIGVTLGYDYGPTVDKNTSIKRDTAPQTEMSFKKAIAQRVDYALAAEKVATALIGKTPEFKSGLKVVGYVDDFPPLYVAISKRHPKAAELAAALDAGLAKIQADGTFKKIEADWDAKLK
ncbi:substrate-binding periplasmic protein [Lacibacterium aquatile]|uniref:Substrate-binding periplasmic protein n=1 Tax=Lacibacterium aquatile TaxID=1168082 RepID=A0ABW5DTM9_9PROT